MSRSREAEKREEDSANASRALAIVGPAASTLYHSPWKVSWKERWSKRYKEQREIEMRLAALLSRLGCIQGNLIESPASAGVL